MALSPDPLTESVASEQLPRWSTAQDRNPLLSSPPDHSPTCSSNNRTPLLNDHSQLILPLSTPTTNVSSHRLTPPMQPCFPFSSSSSHTTNAKTTKDVKKRSSKACDNCRKSKCKCTRAPDPDGVIPLNKPCQNCLTNGLECTFNGTSRKRGPPKGYIEAIESRLHRMEAFLGGLLENDDPRAQALFSELVGDSQLGQLLQQDLKLSAQSANNSKARKSWKPPDISTANCTSFDRKNKSELTDTQKALWGVQIDQLASFKEHRSDPSNQLGPLSSDSEDDSQCENNPSDRSPPLVHDNQYHDHRTRRRRLCSNPTSTLSRRSKLSTFNLPASNATIPHTATATFTLTKPDSSQTYHDSYPLSDNNLQSPQSDAISTTQRSPATITELADVVGQLSLDENDEVRYHGRSSGLYMISASQRYKNFFWHFPKPGFWPVAPIRRSHSTLDIFELVNPLEVLPNLEMMNHLLDFYWAFVHPMMPVLYKAEFVIQFQHLIKNLDKIRLARPHWTENQVWCHALSGANSFNDASPGDSSSYHYSPSPPDENLEPRVFGLEPTNRISMLLLLVIFAISSRYTNQSCSPPAEGQYWNAGDKYLTKAKQILNLDYGNSKLNNCQALILMAYREIGSGAMGESWLYTGMAIRMAQDMGLFRDVDKWFMPVKRFTYEEKQIRKRVWWACINMDKYVSTYIGRPMMIFERDYDTAFPSIDGPDEHEPWKGWSPDGQLIDLARLTSQKSDSVGAEAREDEEKKVTEKKEDPTILDQQPSTHDSPATSIQEKSYTISCFSRSASLSVLTSRIVANIYAIRIRVIGQSSETLLALLDQNLARWYLDLPEQLQYNPQPLPQTPDQSGSPGSATPKRALTPHLLTLHAQFYTALILLHRPFIPPSLSPANPNNRPVDSPPSSPSHSICTTAANAITSIAQAYSQLFGLRQAPVFLVYYIFTAAILHVYNVNSDAGLALTAKANLLKCMNSLKEMAPTWTGAVRAWELLVGLVDLRDHDQSDNQQQWSQPNASNLGSHGFQNSNQSEDRRRKRAASTNEPDDHMKHTISDQANYSGRPNNVHNQSFHEPFNHSQLNFDWIINQEVPKLKSGAPYGSVKLLPPVSNLNQNSVGANNVKKINPISLNTPTCEQEVHLLQSSNSESELRVSNEPTLGVDDQRDLSGYGIENSKYSATTDSLRAPPSHTDDAKNPVSPNNRSGFPLGETNKHYLSGQAALPTTALEEMMGLVNHSEHLYDYQRSPPLQTTVQSPHQSQLQPLPEQQNFQSQTNQQMMFDLNSFTPIQTNDHHPYGTSNTLQGLFGLGGSVPHQRVKFEHEKPQQNRRDSDYSKVRLDKIEPEREQGYNQDRLRTDSSMAAKDNVSFDEMFSESGLNWLSSPVDPMGGYGLNPSYRMVVNPQSHPPPQISSNPHHPTHPTHPLHNYHNYNLNRTQHPQQ